MKTVRVDKIELLRKVRENREKHIVEAKVARDDYQEAAVAKLQAMLDEAQSGKIVSHFDVPEPRDHTDSYDRVIAMLEMSEDQTVDLSHQEFDRYVRDKWEWKRDFDVVNASYAAMKG